MWILVISCDFLVAKTCMHKIRFICLLCNIFYTLNERLKQREIEKGDVWYPLDRTGRKTRNQRAKLQPKSHQPSPCRNCNVPWPRHHFLNQDIPRSIPPFELTRPRLIHTFLTPENMITIASFVPFSLSSKPTKFRATVFVC